MCQCIECIGDQYEPDQIDMMSESELRSELRKLLGTLAAEQEARKQLELIKEGVKQQCDQERQAYLREFNLRVAQDKRVLDLLCEVAQEKQRAEAAEARTVDAHYVGVESARDGLQEVWQQEAFYAHELPEFDSKPLCRIQWWNDSGDMSVGIFPSSGWELAENQEGTILELLISAEARIKASREQDYAAKVSCVWTSDIEDFQVISWELGEGTFELYAQPPIPPDVAELQRQLEEARKVPEGWKLVPVEPTKEMIESAWAVSNWDSESQLRAVYKKMLSAAPTTDQPKEYVHEAKNRMVRF